MSKLLKWTLPIIRIVIRYFKYMLIRKEKQILLLAEFGKFGGTRTYFLALLKYLASKNKKVVLYIYPGQDDKEILETCNSYGFEIYDNPYDFGDIEFHPNLFTKFNINPAKRTIHAINHYLQILLTTRCHMMVCSVGSPTRYLYCFLLPAKLFYIIHTVAETPLESIRKQWLKYTLGHRKQIITVSAFAQNALCNYWLPTKTSLSRYIHYVHNFYSNEALANIQTTNDDAFVVLTIGTVASYKNPKLWIETAHILTRKYKDIRFYWLGDGPELAECKSLTQNNNSICWFGYTPKVEDWYHKASIYFQPSLKESFGISVAGAMAHGLPCVVSDREGLPELIEDRISGWVVDAEHATVAANTIEYLYMHKSERITTGQNAKAKFDKSFTYDIWLKNMSKYL